VNGGSQLFYYTTFLLACQGCSAKILMLISNRKQKSKTVPKYGRIL